MAAAEDNKPAEQRDDVAEQRDDAEALIDFSPKALRKRAKEHAERQVSGRRGYFVKNTKKGWRYFFFNPRGRPFEHLRSLRERLMERGYAPCNGPLFTGKPGPEYVPVVPGAEIWKTTEEIANAEHERRRLRAVALPGWLVMQASRMKRGGMIPQWAIAAADPELVKKLKL